MTVETTDCVRIYSNLSTRPGIFTGHNVAYKVTFKNMQFVFYLLDIGQYYLQVFECSIH